MSTNDTTGDWLDKAVEAGARAIALDRWGRNADGISQEAIDFYGRVSRAAILAALPAITEAIATEIEGTACKCSDSYCAPGHQALRDAEAIRAFGSQVAR